MMFPRWLSWLVFAVLVYLIYSASGSNAPSQISKPVVAPITQEAYPALAAATDVERWKRKINPDYAAKMNCTVDTPKKPALVFTVTETNAGSGEGAACGDTIHVELTIWGVNATPAYSGKTTIALGSRQLASGLDTGLVGIKLNGERLLVLPPYALTRGKIPSENAAAVKALPQGKLAVVSVKRID